jgi:glycosyltransferase involved in cell wall biosynthesis
MKSIKGMAELRASGREGARTIALVEGCWEGHHPTYFHKFCQTALQLGYDTFVICPRPEEILSADYGTRGNGPATEGLLAAVKFETPHRQIRPRRYQERFDAFLANQWLRRTLRELEARHRRKISLVFFTCIYDVKFRYFPRTAIGFPWRWSGLYLHCRSFRMPGKPIQYTQIIPEPEKLFRHPKLQSVAVLDEGAVEYMRGVTGGRSISVFPDVTNETAPAPGGMAEELRQFAAGRPIVGVLGHLHATKGVATLARIALDPANEDMVFAFIGEIIEGVFTPEEREMLSRLKTAPNVFVRFERVPDGALFNAVLQACDVIFAAYHDFPNSSNMLTKAALLERPVLVSEGYLMAERVRRYSLGEIVPENNAPLAAAGLRKILTDKAAWLDQHRPQWQEYRAAHSTEALVQAFGQLLAQGEKSSSNGRSPAGGGRKYENPAQTVGGSKVGVI